MKYIFYDLNEFRWEIKVSTEKKAFHLGNFIATFFKIHTLKHCSVLAFYSPIVIKN